MHAKITSVVSDLCNPIDYSPPGSSVYGILQARILEWLARLSSRESSRPRDQTHVSCMSLMLPALTGSFFTTRVTWETLYLLVLVAQSYSTLCDLMEGSSCQAPLSIEFSRKEYWSRLPLPFPGDLSDPGVKPGSPTFLEDSLPSETPGSIHLSIIMTIKFI